jgi:hypothetical protein
MNVKLLRALCALLLAAGSAAVFKGDYALGQVFNSGRLYTRAGRPAIGRPARSRW